MFGKYFKDGFHVIIYESVGWGDYRGFGALFCRGVGGEVRMSNLDYVW